MKVFVFLIALSVLILLVVFWHRPIGKPIFIPGKSPQTITSNSSATAVPPKIPLKTAPPATSEPISPVVPAGAVPLAHTQAAKDIVAAAKTGTHLERLSPMITPPPFDPVAYAKDPASYVAEVVPGRVMQTAKPGREGIPLTSLTKLEPEMAQGGVVELAVKAVPGAPVTFTAKDGGSFAENHLNSITLQASEVGKASVHFVADQGVTAYAEIMAGCPMTVGNTIFTVYVHYPGEISVAPARSQVSGSSLH